MIDRLKFLVSRGLGPIGNFAILTAIGLRFGRDGIADYTYALAVCGSLYFAVGFALPTYIAVQSSGAAHRLEILWLRLASVVVSCLVAAAAAVVGNEIWIIVAGLWLIKAGDMLFEPVVVFAAIDCPPSERGRQLLRVELVKFLLVQLIIWGTVWVYRLPMSACLAITGLGNLAIGAYYLVSFPKWAPASSSSRTWCSVVRGIASTCAPMAVAGAILALVIGLPRLLLESQLQTDERAMMGFAQVGSSVISLFFNAVWMYELQRIKAACAVGKPSGIFFENARLTIIFFAVLMSAAALLWLVPSFVDIKSAFLGDNAGTIAALLVIFSLPQCFSLHRDVLKLIDQAWLEVWILFATLAAGCLAWHLAQSHTTLGWFGLTIAIVTATSLLQFTASVIALFRTKHEPGKSRHQNI